MRVETVKSVLFGLAIGDALGVPVEFVSREKLKIFPVTKMKGFGSWSQPAGTWSDDSSLAFCLSQSLVNGYNIDDVAKNFVKWLNEGYWGAHHKVFDVGGATRHAIGRLMQGTSPSVSGGMMEDDNGNGSLMRILPLLFYIREKEVAERYRCIKEISSITHAHFRSVFSCFIYMEMALQLLNGKDANAAYAEMQQSVSSFAQAMEFNNAELKLFARVLKANIKDINEDKIHSGGYVLNTLEASLWCLLNTSAFPEAVLKAVNLGGDTDTTGCVTGGLAGLLYGYDNIPCEWINEIARTKDIDTLSNELYLSMNLK